MTVTFRPVQAEDKAQWLALWQGYCGFYASSVPADVTEHTWQRMLDPQSPIFCRVALVEGQLAGRLRTYCQYAGAVCLFADPSSHRLSVLHHAAVRAGC